MFIHLLPTIDYPIAVINATMYTFAMYGVMKKCLLSNALTIF